MKHIVLTGGGTAGHVTPNIALIPTLKAAGYQISYIGSYEGIERKLIEEMGIPYYGISSGKLRRYFDPKNFSDPFRVLKGFHEAKKASQKTETRCSLFQGWFRYRPCCNCSQTLQDSSNHPRIRYDSGTCQQTVYSISR